MADPRQGIDPRESAPSDPRAAGNCGQPGGAPLSLPPGGPDNPEIFVKVIIPDDKALDISQGGRSNARLKQIQSSCSVHVRLASPGCFFPGSGDERAALLSGFAESVRVALSQLLEITEQDPSDPLVHLAIPSQMVNTLLIPNAGQAMKYVGQTTHTQISLLPSLPNFDETVIRIQRFSRTPEAPVVCVANASVMLIRMILDIEPNFEFNTTINYEVPGMKDVSSEPEEYEPVPILNPQEAARLRMEFLQSQVQNLAKGHPAGPATITSILESEWAHQVDEESELLAAGPIPTPQPKGPPLDTILANAGAIAGSMPHVLEVQCMVRVPRINNKQASAIIGVKGANIRDIQEASGCKVKIIDSPDAIQTGGIGPSATSLKEVVMTGAVNQVHSALIGIAELMNEADHGATEAFSRVSLWLREQRNQAYQPPPPPDMSMRGSSRRNDDNRSHNSRQDNRSRW
jgi:hypothetical protein